MNLLLLGKDGQVGTALQQSLLPLGSIISVGRSQMDLSHLDVVREQLKLLKPNVIINAAAYTAVDQAESQPTLAMCLNADLLGVLAHYCKTHQAILVHYSTDYVFDGKSNHPYQETDQPNPLNVYGQSKLLGEQKIIESGCPHLIFRTSWVYSAVGQNFIKTVLRLAKEREQLRLVSDQWGAPTSASMIANVTAIALSHLKKNPTLSGIYHLSAQGETNWHALATYVIEHMKMYRTSFKATTIEPITTEEYPLPAKRPKNSRLDNAKLERTFGLQLPDWRIYVDLTLAQIHSMTNIERN
jgi:dTDP-4-dehydrorhamnose reductase